MKKCVMLAVFTLSALLAACTGAVTEEVSSASSVSTDAAMFTSASESTDSSDASICEILFPAKVQFAGSQEEADRIAGETDFDSVIYREDGSVLVTMDRNKRKEYVYELAGEYEKQIETLQKESVFSAVSSVSHNGAWTVFSVTLEREETDIPVVSENERSLGDILIRFGEIYQIASGVEKTDVTVNYIDRLGNRIDSMNSSSER